MRQVFVGLIAEGPTDYRFLTPVILNSLIEIAIDCKGQIDVDVIPIYIEKDKYAEWMLDGAVQGFQDFGIDMLIVHTDADDSNHNDVMNNRFLPSLQSILDLEDVECCKKILPLIPVHETESWMLADTDLLRKYINTDKTDADLEITGNPERFADPKQKLADAIRIGRSEMPRKIRESLKIADLYSIIGQSIDLRKLSTLASYQQFIRNAKKSFGELNLL